MTDLESAVRQVHDHLAATEELPLDREATRWIAEAEAVAADLREVDDEAVVRRRLGHVRELLANVDGTGHAGADDHVAAAKELVDEVVE